VLLIQLTYYWRRLCVLLLRTSSSSSSSSCFNYSSDQCRWGLASEQVRPLQPCRLAVFEINDIRSSATEYLPSNRNATQITKVRISWRESCVLQHVARFVAISFYKLLDESPAAAHEVYLLLGPILNIRKK